ncbi:MAG TPA: MoaD family protein [Nocardioidaceae bacterium]|nr:MoaD family protein [Nocardioidaceae bacterium]
MSVEVQVPTILRGFTGGSRAVESDGATLAALLDNLDREHPGIKERIVDTAELRRFINVYVNDEDVRFTGGLQTPLSDGDVVVVLPAVAGGQDGAPRRG